MTNLKNRSSQKELLDADDIPFSDIKSNMQELDTINTVLGGHAITLEGLKTFLAPRRPELFVCEIGCGGGDNLRAIQNYCAKKNIAVKLLGIDKKKECIEYAAERNSHLDAEWTCSDYQLVDLKMNPPDIIFSSLFCHHFSNEELVQMIHWMMQNSRLGFFINDLHRHPIAYFSIKWITSLFSSSYLVKHDAPLSVARGFNKREWQKIFSGAGLKNYSIRWMWAFRYLIVCKHD